MIGRLVAGRLLDLAVVLASVSVLVFFMIRLIPGDAVAIMLGANTEVTPERIAALRASIGLDQPIVLQYLGWVGRALRGDFGTSLWTGRPVIDEIAAFLLVLFLVGQDPLRQAFGFLLFRLFDIVKPPPIRQLDAAIKNGVGVMLDDFVAAGYALIVFALGVRVLG